MKQDAVIFYSWQSDDHDTRSYVENAIRGAIKSMLSAPKVQDAPRPKMDKDTQGAIGAVDIAKIIQEKIDLCDVFLADVSMIGKMGEDKLVNQNVMYELGYAIGKHSESKIILVSNIDLGDPKELPFDINGKRVITFSPTTDPKRTKFKEALKEAFEAHLGRVGDERKINTKSELHARLMTALENGKPVRSKAERYFSTIFKDLAEQNPGRFHGGDALAYGEKVYLAFQNTKETVAEIFEVIENSGEHKKADIFTAAFQSLEILTRGYDPMPEDNGTVYRISSEYYSLLANEIVQYMYGVLALNDMWFEMGILAKIEHDRPASNTEPAIDQLYRKPEAVGEFYKIHTNQSWVYPTIQIFTERWGEGSSELKMLTSGGLLLYLLRSKYFGYTIGKLLLPGWGRYVPAYMYEFGSHSFIHSILDASDSTTTEDLKPKIAQRATREIGNSSFEFYDLSHVFAKAGIDPVDGIGGSTQVISIL